MCPSDVQGGPPPRLAEGWLMDIKTMGISRILRSGVGCSGVGAGVGWGMAEARGTPPPLLAEAWLMDINTMGISRILRSGVGCSEVGTGVG